MGPASKPNLTIPDKLYFRIGEVSRIAGVPTSVLRFWESAFPRIKPKRTEAGQRLYRRNDVELILMVKHLLYEKKYTIKGARHHLSAAPSKKEAVDSQEDLVNDIRTELHSILKLLD
jgi:DNA-binding transcriptional MerR regulator